MNLIRIPFLLIITLIGLSFTVHKFYVSVTKIEYIEKEQALQVISKIFVDDIEAVLQARYNNNISLGDSEDTEQEAFFLKKYVTQKFSIVVDGVIKSLDYLGYAYDNDLLKIYMEVPEVSSLSSIEIENKMLTEHFKEQQNIIHLKNNENRKTLILERDNPKGLLKLN